MPIDEDLRFWAGSGCIIPGGPRDWYLTDFDQRRMITVRMDDNEEEEETAVEHLKKHIDTLGPDVTFVHLSPGGDLVSTSTSPDHDQTMCVYYPPLALVQPPDGDVQTIVRTELRELDRLGPNIDLVSYQTGTKPVSTRKVAFKYYWHGIFIWKFWKEIDIWMRLPPHANIVPFDRLVLDELDGNVVGFTSLYIPGGTLEDSPPPIFKLKWLQQLTQVIDDLNLRHGIWHQDVAPRNLLVDTASDNIKLFDFIYSARVGYRYADGSLEHEDARDDVQAVVFTLYELITRDFHFRENTLWEKLDMAMVQDVEWVTHHHVKLDHDLAEYRALLDAWVKKRMEGNKIELYTDAPEYIDWPGLKQPLVEMRYGNLPPRMVQTWVLCDRRTARAEGREIVEWERPIQSTLGSDCHLLATGKLLEPAVA
jgi:hypothetical protein